MLKSIFDKSLALFLLIILSPIFVFTACLVSLKLGSPIIFSQPRIGYDNKVFKFYKFRTMKNLKDNQGNLLSDAERLTKTGIFLRKTSLDELPQLWNVLKGQMSFVGPRPLLVEYLPLYSAEQIRRHSVKPGITGWAQVNGRNSLAWEDKFLLDVFYVDHQSFLLDLKILWMTFWKVLSSRGTSADGHATMPKFMGNEDDDIATYISEK